MFGYLVIERLELGQCPGVAEGQLAEDARLFGFKSGDAFQSQSIISRRFCSFRLEHPFPCLLAPLMVRRRLVWDVIYDLTCCEINFLRIGSFDAGDGMMAIRQLLYNPIRNSIAKFSVRANARAREQASRKIVNMPSSKHIYLLSKVPA